jgi:hypothetical protein
MKRYGYLSLSLLVLILFAGTLVSLAQTPVEHPRPDVDGFTWLKSTDAEKKAFLFGAGSAVAMEYHVRAKRNEEPSRFVKGWTEGLKNTSWSELATKVDSYYDTNPERRNLHVFEVIWHEAIKPGLKN